MHRTPALSEAARQALLDALQIETRQIETLQIETRQIETEYCFNIEVSAPLEPKELQVLRWLLSETFEPDGTADASRVSGEVLFEVGPRLNFQTAWSSNAVSVCRAVGIEKVTRIERTRRFALKTFALKTSTGAALSEQAREFLLGKAHDRMTERPYPDGIATFETGLRPEPVSVVPLIKDGRAALEKINQDMGLGLDDWDLQYYLSLFVNDIGRDPTNVECFDLGQSNSEHSRHWFFQGRLVIDGQEMPYTLMQAVKAPIRANPGNSVIAFRDNSSAIKGYEITTIVPEAPGKPCRFVKKNVHYNIIFTAETHNFPSGVAPFPGAETGTGGRIRDVQATGRGGLVVAGTAAYCVGNLQIPGYALPWEDASFEYPENLATPLRIEIEASNGASDYGNKFGEPVIQGYTRSFGLRLPGGERREWIKPIMFTAGVGQMDAGHTEKGSPEPEMLVVKIGGPAYRIGLGGGAASSMIQGENVAELDFNAVQRGDAEMEQKMNRVIRACVEMGPQTPIISLHDQGAGGNCNVLKEIVDPAGARIDVRKIQVADATLSVLEIWGAEYQEQNALLIRPEAAALFEALCLREKTPCAFVGEITGDGRVVLVDSADGSTPVDLDLAKVLAEMPQKTFDMKRMGRRLEPLSLPKGLTVREALEQVLRLLSVGSKRFLTNKVDRSVTGLIARQQCCGPLQLTVSDAAVVAQGHFGLSGAAISIGEQPVVGLIDPAAMGRKAVAEALTNIVWARVSRLSDIKCSANWMWAAKLPGEGPKLHDAAIAMADIMVQLGIAVDGGKDSLSMAAVLPSTGEVVKSPGALVVSAYVTVPDVTKVITPDIKAPGQSRIMYIDLGGAKYRLGASSLAHVYGQIGDTPPDIDDPALLKNTFEAVQGLISKGLVLSGHDRSDGGLVTALLEMAFSGNCGLRIDLSPVNPNSDNMNSDAGAIPMLFSEESGLLFEYLPKHEAEIKRLLEGHGVPVEIIGDTLKERAIEIKINGQSVLDEPMPGLRELWEETSHRLELLQANPECVRQEKQNIYERSGPSYVMPAVLKPEVGPYEGERPLVAVIREEGSNGDREMTSAFYSAGFEPWDVAMTDLMAGRVTLRDFRGVVFVGGFSYADVLDSAKGWAGVIRFNAGVRAEFEDFYGREDTFSLGVCNGCQLMALLGWVPWAGIEDKVLPRFIRNTSGRFESRFSTVKILPSPSIMLKGMEGSVLGVWVAHGEGRFFSPDTGIFDEIKSKGLAPVRYADDRGEPTEAYPFNPNGSPEGITALCSPDGRHLAMMPHPERAFLNWQWGWLPEEMKADAASASPWLSMFENARRWCLQKS